MTPKSPRRRVRRVPLSELSIEDLVVRDPMEDVCRRIGALAVATRRPPAPRTSARSQPPRDKFTVFEDPCAVHGTTHLLGARTRAMCAALAHDDKENQPP